MGRAQEAIAALKTGEKFSDVAARFSEDKARQGVCKQCVYMYSYINLFLSPYLLNPSTAPTRYLESI